MRQIIVGGYKDLLNNAATEYTWLAGGTVWGTLETEYGQLVSTPGTIDRLIVKLDGVAGAGKTWTFTIMKNGSPTALTCSIGGDTDTEGEDTSHTVSVSAGNRLTLRSTSSGSPTARNATWCFGFSGDIAKESLFLGYCDAYKLQSRFSGIAGLFVSSADEDNDYQRIPVAGKIKNLFVQMLQAPGTGAEAYKYTLRLNKVSTNLTATITGTDKTGNNTINEVAVTADDKVGLYIEPLNSPDKSTVVFFGFTFVADTDGESCVLGGQVTSPSVNDVSFTSITSSGVAFVSDETTAFQLTRPCLLKNLYVEVEGTPGGSSSWDITVRKNGVDTDLTVNIAGAAITGSNTSDSVLFDTFDYVNVEITPNNTPGTVLNGLNWGVVMVPASISPSPSEALARVTALVIHWSAGPNAVYQEEVLTGGLFSQYFSPVSAQKEPEPTIPTLRQPQAWQPTIRQYGRWLAAHTHEEQVSILGTTRALSFAEWSRWVLSQLAIGRPFEEWWL